MPRGVPKAGFRKRRKSKNKSKNDMTEMTSPSNIVSNETDQEISERISDRFEILSDLTDAAVKGEIRSLIVSGPAGLGKSYTVEQALDKWDPERLDHTIVKGYVRATGLYKLLFTHAEKGKVLVFDDADTIFFDDTSLNMLKAVCDSTERRVVSYLTEGTLFDDDSGTQLPKSFEFNGTIIFITNYDFSTMIDRGHKLAPHLLAMMSRAHYIDLAMSSSRDYMIRIKQVINQGLLKKSGLNDLGQSDVVAFIETNQNKLRELSIRIALKIASLRKTYPNKWEKISSVTCCK